MSRIWGFPETQAQRAVGSKLQAEAEEVVGVAGLVRGVRGGASPHSRNVLTGIAASATRMTTVVPHMPVCRHVRTVIP